MQHDGIRSPSDSGHRDRREVNRDSHPVGPRSDPATAAIGRHRSRLEYRNIIRQIRLGGEGGRRCSRNETARAQHAFWRFTVSHALYTHKSFSAPGRRRPNRLPHGFAAQDLRLRLPGDCGKSTGVAARQGFCRAMTPGGSVRRTLYPQDHSPSGGPADVPGTAAFLIPGPVDGVSGP